MFRSQPLEEFQFICSLESLSLRVSFHPVYSVVEVSLQEPAGESSITMPPISITSVKPVKPHKRIKLLSDSLLFLVSVIRCSVFRPAPVQSNSIEFTEYSVK